MTGDENNRVIDLVGYLKHLWAHKVVFLVTFLVILGVGAGWALTRPAQYDVTQTVMVTLPTADTEAEATQQTASLHGTVANYVKMASLPVVAQPVIDAHGVDSLEMLRAMVSVTPVGPLAIDLKATGENPDELTGLVGDLAANWVATAPTLITDLPDHLRLTLSAVDTPVVTAAASGRLIRLAASGVLALLAATAVTAAVAAVSSRRTP